ncbi:hypothetical protein BDV96DRAFT_628749 [Lophiotrema nucula]|uniref:C2H2-type domain-containing protein n=1 Tax=Lophiotrema nucula TaxID=690887 RepID=A0A6A5ZKX9_9PLEO|nr:hypothetical protein BDV96DRAFT_628749 [Lophiotrema nucula]
MPETGDRTFDDSMMVMAGSTDFRRSNAYGRTRHGASTSGFLTPPSPFEGRRDSIASSQSSYCHSFGSATDCSGPVTPPTCGRSPLADDGFNDAVSYELANDYQGHSFHGLPLAPHMKEPSMTDGVCDQWVMVPSPVVQALQTHPFRSHTFNASSGEFGPSLHANMDSHAGLNGIATTSVDPAWGNVPALAWSEGEQQPNRIADQQIFHSYYPGLLNGQFHHTMGVSTETIIPSESMFDVHDDFVHVNASTFVDEPLDNIEQSFCPSPEEVSFKRERSASIKEDPDLQDEKPSVQRSIYETPTGGKSVKRERRDGGTKKKLKPKKKNPKPAGDRRLASGVVGLFLEDLEYDPVTAKLVSTVSTRAPLNVCRVWKNGQRCGKVFKRPEHLKRHEYTHSGEQNFPCKICPRTFSRNDNCLAHYGTHLRMPGKKDGRNPKFTIREIEEMLAGEDPKIIEKMRAKWRSEAEQATNRFLSFNCNIGTCVSVAGVEFVEHEVKEMGGGMSRRSARVVAKSSSLLSSDRQMSKQSLARQL